MRTINQACLIRLSLLASATLLLAASVNAQTTQFTYQGKLADTGSPGSGQYDFQFSRAALSLSPASLLQWESSPCRLTSARASFLPQPIAFWKLQ